MTDAAHLPDAADRRRIETDLDTNLFIDAGAGAGKTTALVARIVNLVVLRGVPIGSIVAITFTRKAAEELRHRLRRALEDAGADISALDLAPIGTLHAFAQRLLGEHAIDADLPPRFRVLDEVQSVVAFDERFDDFARSVLDDPEASRLVLLSELDDFRLPINLRRIAQGFQDNWDLVAERVSADRPPVAQLDLGEVTDLVDSLAARSTAGGSSAERRCAELLAMRHGASTGELDLICQFLALAVKRASWKGVGNKNDWKRANGSEEGLEQFRADGERLSALAAVLLQQLRDERRLLIGALLRDFTLNSADDRRRRGELEFHDLLVLARQLLRDHAHVRADLHDRYRVMLLDEFQDTDPIQLELALRITSRPTDEPIDWRDLQPLPGRLCVVGDPKQSIYRFRRADIGAYLDTDQRWSGSHATLSSNFRSSEAVVDWVNATMASIIQAEPGVQADYVASSAQREVAPGIGSVTVLGVEAHEAPMAAEPLRIAEAEDVASAVVQALTEGWPVSDQHAPDGTRACAPGDICILLPTRTSLAVLEAALQARHVVYRAENSSLVYAEDEPRALLLALRAVDDPGDQLATVSVLRTMLFGCSDRELHDWRVVHGGSFDWQHRVPSGLHAHPVARALSVLRDLANEARSSPPSQVLQRLIESQQMFEWAATEPNTREIWRRLRFVVDQARAWSDSGGHGLRHYLEWVRLQSQDGRFASEAVLPETDQDVVRIMTIHAAKGLEFPITIVAGLTTRPRPAQGAQAVWTDSGWTISDRSDQTYADFVPVDEQMSDAERARLWYVACTRARDHLVVSTHRVAGATYPSAASRLAEAALGVPHRPLAGTDRVLQLPPPSAARDQPLPDEAFWAQRATVLAAASSPRVLSATSLAAAFADDPGLRKGAVDLDLPPWQRGRYGTEVGRAVHAVLQYADLDTGADIDVLAAAQAAAEGVPGLERRIASLARSAIATDTVQAGIRGRHWRELFVAVQIGDRVIEGYIDLLVRRPDGSLLVVDYKTDQLPDGHDAPLRIQQYSRQLAAYGVALEEILHEPVAGGVLVMCHESAPATEVWIDNWQSLGHALRSTLVG